MAIINAVKLKDTVAHWDEELGEIKFCDYVGELTPTDLSELLQLYQESTGEKITLPTATIEFSLWESTVVRLADTLFAGWGYVAVDKNRSVWAYVDKPTRAPCGCCWSASNDAQLLMSAEYSNVPAELDWETYVLERAGSFDWEAYVLWLANKMFPDWNYITVDRDKSFWAHIDKPIISNSDEGTWQGSVVNSALLVDGGNNDFDIPSSLDWRTYILTRGSR